MGFVTPAQRYDVVCVGDVSTDVFIRLPEANFGLRTDDRGTWLEIPFGAKLPYERSTTVEAGGSAANVAVGLARLGLRVGLASFLAHDEIGRDLLAALHTEEIDTRLVHIDSPAHTNRNFVLSYRAERTILVWHEDFDYHWPHLRPSEVPTWLYLTSLGGNARAYEDQIAEWLEETPNVRLVLEPGTLQAEDGPDRLQRLLRRAEVLICDRQHASLIAGGGEKDASSLVGLLLKLGPRQVVVIDKGGGAAASDGHSHFVVPPFPDESSPLDRTGADDAFAAGVTAALIRGLPFEQALRWGPADFMAVSHHMGSQAGLLRDAEMISHLDELGERFSVQRA